MCSKQVDNGVGSYRVDKPDLGGGADMRQEVEEKRQEGRRGRESMVTLSSQQLTSGVEGQSRL